MRALYLTNIPTPYIVERFNAIARQPGLDFNAAFLERTHADRSWLVVESQWDFRFSYVGVGVKGALAAHRLVRRLRPDVLVTLYFGSEFLSGMAAARAVKAEVVVHVMKTFPSWNRRTPYREHAKRLLFPRVDVHATGPDAAAYATSYGASPERIFTIPEPVDVEHFAHGAQLARRRGDRLGDGVVFLYVGRIWEGKGIGHLLEAFALLQREEPDTSLVLVGDGVDTAKYRQQAQLMDRVHFRSFVQRPNLPEVYGSADVLVFPTLGDPYGHVVQEAMAAGLPVISTSAAGDIADRLSPGETGLIVPPADPSSLASAMRSLALDAGLRSRMGEAGFERIRTRTVDWWAAAFAQMLRTVADRKRTT